jgi:DNA-binding NtrC family response regulator
MMTASKTIPKLPCLYWWHTVLLVDDEGEARRAVGRTLHREPYDLLTADSPRSALERILQKDVSLVIADRRMPEMEGDRLLEEVWKRSPTTVGVILSGYPSADGPAPELERRPRCVLGKPWEDAELKRTIRQLLAERERELVKLVHR